MNRRRRQVLTELPLGLAGAAFARQQTPPRTPARLLSQLPPNVQTLRWTPDHRDLVYTFGGAAPKHRIASGTHIVSWTEDCFDGAVKTARELPSKVMSPRPDNPQTGPFFVEGAEPGDTVAVHLLKLEPARDYAVSSVAPGF